MDSPDNPFSTPPAPPSPLGDVPLNNTLAEDLEETVTHLIQHARYLSLPQKERLRASLMIGQPLPEAADQIQIAPETKYNASFDLGDEVEQQIKAVRAIRAQVFDGNGNMRGSVSSREAKEIISTGSTMLSTLMKYHEKVMNMERLRKLELSVMEALSEASTDLQEKALALLEEKLLSDEAA